jgi:hypothetical protein
VTVIGKPTKTIRDLANETLDQQAELRGLVESGGYPYIKITITNPENGEVEIQHHGLAPDVDLAAAFQELALLIAERDAA